LAALAVAAGLMALFISHDKGVWVEQAFDACPATAGTFCPSLLFKSMTTSVELLILAVMVFITIMGRKQRWQEHWMTGRSLAEILRPSRLHFIIGGAPYRRSTHTDEAGLQRHQIRLPWYIRASLREIELPTGVVGQDQLQRAIDVAIVEELGAQEEYHERTHGLLEALDHRLELICLACLGAAFLIGLYFLGAFFAQTTSDGSGYAALYKWKSLATYAGGVLPAIGASLFGIRVIGDFKSAVRQSERMIGRIAELRDRYEYERFRPARLTLRELNARTTLIMADDILIWNMIFSERELTPGA